MINNQNSKQYDLERRSLQFAQSVRNFLKKINKSISNNEDSKQLIRASGSIGANYIEANEALSKKDFLLRVKISRKEAKESIFWLNLLDISPELEKSRSALLDEATQLMKIFGAIITKSS